MVDPVWVDGTTPLNSANLTKLQTRDEKGAASGYASLDSGGKVPLAQLPISYGTTLPGSPVDGQEAILVDSITNPTYQWRFRYNTGNTTAYKWEFIGGSDVHVGPIGAESTTSTAGYQDLATVGPRFVVPRAGNYDASAGAICNHGVAGTLLYLILALGTAMQDQTPVAVPMAAQWAAHGPMYFRFAGLAAGNEIRVRYYNVTAGTATWNERWLQVRPVAVA